MRARHCSRPAAMRWDPPGWFPEGALGPHFADKEVRFRGGEAAQGLCRGQSAKSGTCGLSAQAPPTHCPRLFCSVPAAAQGLGLRGEGAPARQTRQGGRCRGGPVPLGVGAPPPPGTLMHTCSRTREHTLHAAAGRNPGPEIAVSPLEAQCLSLAAVPWPGKEAGRGRLQRPRTAQGGRVHLHTHTHLCTHTPSRAHAHTGADSHRCMGMGRGGLQMPLARPPEGPAEPHTPPSSCGTTLHVHTAEPAGDLP